MAPRVLVSTTSFLDTPGTHRDRLRSMGYEIIPARGPLSEGLLLDIIKNQGPFDGFLCGEDEFTPAVIQAIGPTAKVISKYGVSIERIDLEGAKKFGIQVLNTPRVNHTTVAELTFGLLIAATRQIPRHNNAVHSGRWERATGIELAGKTLGVFGLGRVGREVVKRGLAFDMKVLVFNTNWNASHEQFVQDLNRLFSDPLYQETKPSVSYGGSADEVLQQSDFISLHINISKENRAFLDRHKIALCKRGSYVVNVSRGALVDQAAMAEALKRGHIAGYAADVLDPEPVNPDNPLLGLNNVVLTPHVASRTYESVERQGTAALDNLKVVLG
jgi:D-3-phosphoglycerate dehydrogenase